jgi:hypothetical protein
MFKLTGRERTSNDPFGCTNAAASGPRSLVTTIFGKFLRCDCIVVRRSAWAELGMWTNEVGLDMENRGNCDLERIDVEILWVFSSKIRIGDRRPGYQNGSPILKMTSLLQYPNQVQISLFNLFVESPRLFRKCTLLCLSNRAGCQNGVTLSGRRMGTPQTNRLGVKAHSDLQHF